MKKFRNVVALLLCLVLTLSLGTANASAVDVSGNDSFKSISCNGVKEFPDGQTVRKVPYSSSKLMTNSVIYGIIMS